MQSSLDCDFDLNFWMLTLNYMKFADLCIFLNKITFAAKV